MTVQALYQGALNALGGGRLAEAERLFKKVLKKEPGHAGALNLLTIVLTKLERFAEAEKYIAAAVASNQQSDASYFNYGLISQKLGKLQQAQDQFSKAIELNPSAFQNWNSRGVIFNKLGQYDRAIADFDKAISLNPKYYEAFYHKGQSLFELGQYEEAATLYDKTIALKPDMAEAWFGRGKVCAALERYGEAEICYARALVLKPDFPEASIGYCKVLLVLRRYKEALACCDKSLSLSPELPAVWVWRGTALAELMRYDEALAAFNKALSLDHEMAEAWVGRGDVFARSGRYEEALADFDKALMRNPALALGYGNKGNVLVELGRFEEAGEAYRKALAIDAENVSIHAQLLTLKKVVPDDPDMAAAEKLLARQSPSKKMSRAILGFALGKAWADTGHYRRALEQWTEANALMRSLIEYNEMEIASLFERIEQVFSSELIAAKCGYGDPRSTPIFILGMPRSGTTMVEQILASHPMVHGAGELTLFGDLLCKTRQGGKGAYPDFVIDLEGSSIRRLAEEYIEELSRMAPYAERVTDKLPGNFEYIGMIHLALPNAKIIHIRRDPIDNCVSCFSLRFTKGHHYSYDLAELGRFYRRYQRLMRHWYSILPQGRILDVNYEDVVADLEGQARRILAHCDLPWDPQCLSFHQSQRAVRTASLVQVRQPIHANSVGRWHAYPDLLRPLLNELAEQSLPEGTPVGAVMSRCDRRPRP